ncbi:DUF4055 domain-containing protein [Cribrihabitans neustonicus]|uniref:DUF4055 domain-containing protein n=1 Tax=Cribrihabitans neustonicus TaxID=1429085 RepID=UPI003B5B84FE
MSFSTNPRAGIAAQFHIIQTGALHPDYTYWAPIWLKIRDAELGEVQIKSKGQQYLPKLAGHDAEQYKSFLQRATYFNMTSKTVNALYGSLTSKKPVVNTHGFDIPGRLTKDGLSLPLAAKTACREVVTLGRFGMLVDADADGKGSPFVATYTAENIMDWEVAELDGEVKLSRVVLREASFDRSPDASPHQINSRFRVLCLEPSPSGWQYTVYLYDDRDGSGIPDTRGLPDQSFMPTVRGRTLDHIPFVIVGPVTIHPDVQKPPLLDIVTLNLSHYQSYAHLEQGRFYTASPVYTVSGDTGDGEAGEYFVGPDMVWELGQNGEAKILEFAGKGLTSLEHALTQKEAQIAAIGGRMMPTTDGAPGEGKNALRRREFDERTLLLNIADCVDGAFTQVLRWLADWSNAPKSAQNLTFKLPRDFVTKKRSDARELRALHMLYKEGHIPLTVLFDALQNADVIPDWMDREEFENLLNDEDQFPNLPDIKARMRGYPDAETMMGAT